MKKKYLVFIEIIVIIIIGCIVYRDAVNYYGDERKLWVVENSPDGKYSMEIYYDMTKLPFAKQQLGICVNDPSFDLTKKNNDNEVDEYKTYLSVEINNKNQPITRENYKLEWQEDGAILTLNGKGQEPISYIIKWDNVFMGEIKQ